jgi:hypothetical protein
MNKTETEINELAHTVTIALSESLAYELDKANLTELGQDSVGMLVLTRLLGTFIAACSTDQEHMDLGLTTAARIVRMRALNVWAQMASEPTP